VLKTIVAAALMAALLPAQGPPDRNPPAVVRVAAAADLRFVLDRLAARLAQQTSPVQLDTTYGSSGTLHAQLRQRAPFDVFLSADVSYPEDLVTRGLAAQGDLFVYATGRIVLWVPTASVLPIESRGVAALASARRIAIANPEHAPYGRAARAAMQAAGVWDGVQARLLLAENIAQAAQYVQAGGADAGVIAKSLAVVPAMRTTGRSVDVPQDSYPPIIQGGVILPWARSRKAAFAVREALLAPEGRALLAEYGFGVPPQR
jgi:molybdate transport system substrate-binding protein